MRFRLRVKNFRKSKEKNGLNKMRITLHALQRFIERSNHPLGRSKAKDRMQNLIENSISISDVGVFSKGWTFIHKNNSVITAYKSRENCKKYGFSVDTG